MEKEKIIINEWKQHAPELATFYKLRFFNREDRYGTYKQNEQGKWKPTTKHDLTLDIIKKHCRLEGTPIGTLAGRYKKDRPPEEDDTKFFCIDIDVHSENDSPELVTKDAESIIAFLSSYGLKPLIEDSNGKGGLHLWYTFNPFLPMWKAHRVGEYIKSHIVGGEIEFFPKREDTRTEKNCGGNWIRLPGRHHKSEHISRIRNEKGEWESGEKAIQLILSAPSNLPGLLDPILKKIEETPIKQQEIKSPAPVNVDDSYFNSSTYEKCVNWLLTKAPIAISHQGGSATTFSVGCNVYFNFDQPVQAKWLELMMKWNERCQPPWTEAELLQKYPYIVNKNSFSGDRGDCKERVYHLCEGFESPGKSSEKSENKFKNLINCKRLMDLPKEPNYTGGYEWVWNDLSFKGGISALCAISKAGKTTLLMMMAKSAEQGGVCIRPVKKMNVLFYTEEPRPILEEHIKEFNPGPNVYYQHCEWRPNKRDFPLLCQAVREDAIEKNVELVIFDTYNMEVPNINQNSGDDTGEVFKVIKEHLRSPHYGLLFVVHAKKTGAFKNERARLWEDSSYIPGENIRGSGDIGSQTDINIDLFVPAENQRVLKWIGRGIPLSTECYNYNVTTSKIDVLPGPQDDDKQFHIVYFNEKIKPLLEVKPRSRKEIIEATGQTLYTVKHTLEVAENHGLIIIQKIDHGKHLYAINKHSISDESDIDLETEPKVIENSTKGEI